MAFSAPTSQSVQQVNPMQDNAFKRALILNSQQMHSMPLGTYSLSPGQTQSIKMRNVGLLVGLTAIVRLTYTATNAPTVGAQGLQGAKALVNKIQFVDIDGVSRINASAFEIACINSANFGEREFVIAQDHFGSTPESYLSLVYDNVTPSASAGSAAFALEIPLCRYKAGDLAGMVNLQSVVGDAYLQITAASLSSIFAPTGEAANDEKVFSVTDGLTAPVFTITNFEVELYQNYYMAQMYPTPAGNVLSFPELDLQTVYAIEGGTFSSDNLSANQTKQISLPNNRNIRRALYTFYNNGLLGGVAAVTSNTYTAQATDVQRVKFLTGAGDYHRDLSTPMQYLSQKRKSRVDLGLGVIDMNFTDAPVSTSVFGTMQTELVCPASVTTPKVGICYESYYMKGSSLANVTQ